MINEWAFKQVKDFTPEYEKKILNKHKDMSYETAKYRYEFAKNKQFSFPRNTEIIDRFSGQKCLTWSDEDLDKIMYWEYVERYYQIILSEKAREDELQNPLHKEFVNKDIIITDPCYIFDDYCEAENKDVLMRDTIYGDWSCTTFNSDTEEKLGEFCADAGMVCVVETDNEMINKDKLNKLREHCRTIIKNFTGTVYIKRIPDNYSDEIQIIGEGNINFIGKQTGL